MENVLIIEDDEAYCELVERCLRENGFGVIATHNLKDGIRAVCEARPAAVVLDLSLPDSPMHQTVEAVKRYTATESAIVVLSGNPEAAADCIKQSASGFISKNAGLKYLGTEIRNAIASVAKIQRIDSARAGLSACHI